MRVHLAAELFWTPGVQRFLHALQDDLTQSRSLLVLLPVGMEPSQVWAMLRGELWRRDFSIEEVSIENLPADCTPVVALANALSAKWDSVETPRTTANFLMCEGLPDIVRLEGLERLSVALRRAWLDLISQWVQSAQSTRDSKRLPPALCVLVPAVALLPLNVPETNILLTVRWWWRVFSALELRLLCRFGDDEEDVTGLWREHLLPALAADDVSLAEYLWDDSRLEVDLLMQRLQAFAQERGWTVDSLRTWGAEQLISASDHVNSGATISPPERMRVLWAHGGLHWTPEYGLELHTAALAVLGRQEDLKHRLWRGQAALLLPLIDGVRLRLCMHLTHAYGDNWPVRWCQPNSPEEIEAVTNSPFACQWGYLAWLLENCVNLGAERQWLPLVERSRWIRNELAHYRPITFLDFELFWHELRKTKKAF